MNDILDQVNTALQRGERIALMTLVRSFGSTPRHKSARLAVFDDGNFTGSIGGGTMELQAVADAQAALEEGKPRLIEYNLNGRGEGNVGLCGGTQEVFIDILRPPTRDAESIELLSAIRAALADGEPVVLATVIRSGNENVLPLGKRIVIRSSGETIGSFANPALDRAISDETQRVLSDNYAHRLGFNPALSAVQRLTSTRRAPVEILLDLFEPRPQLLIIGAGHIGAALTKVAKYLGWHVRVVDDRADFLTRDHLPDADETRLVEYVAATEKLAPMNLRVTASTAVVIATWGWDEPALRQLAGAPAFYVGLVASARKSIVIFDALRAEGIDSAWLDRVRVPVGLDVGAETPEEIALAIMAEILAVARHKSGRPLQQIRRADPVPLSVQTSLNPAAE